MLLPGAQRYQVAVTGAASGSYLLHVGGFALDGSKSTTDIAGQTDPGAVALYSVQYSPAPGVATLVSPYKSTGCNVTQGAAPTVADVQQIIDESLGFSSADHDLNGDGVVNVTDVQVVANAVAGIGCWVL